MAMHAENTADSTHCLSLSRAAMGWLGREGMVVQLGE